MGTGKIIQAYCKYNLVKETINMFFIVSSFIGRPVFTQAIGICITVSIKSIPRIQQEFTNNFLQRHGNKVPGLTHTGLLKA